MPTFFTFHGIKIQLFHRDHAPPHFHAVSAEHELLINIKTLEVMEGSMPKKKQKQIINWAKDNQSNLMEIWHALQKR